MTKSKLPLLLLLIGIITILVIGGWFLLSKKGSSQEVIEESKQIIEPVNQIPIKKRPFTFITPRSDGREVTITINQLDNYSEVEYELEYQAGTLLQGAFGKIDFTKEESPVERNVLLGSCSAGGACSYHEDVNGGTLSLRYLNGEVTKLKGEWNFQQMREQKGRLSSRDAKFTFNVGERGLAANTFVIVSQTMGLPGEVEGEIVGGPYVVSLPKGVTLRGKQIDLSMRTTSDDTDIRLLGWSQDGWIEYEGEINDKTLTATVDQATTFVAISSSVSI